MAVRVRVSGGTVVLLGGVLAVGFWQLLRGGVTMGELWGAVMMWGAIALSSVLHEVGHLMAAWGMTVRVRGLSLDVLGARMVLSGGLTYGQEAVVACGGPLVSLVTGALLWPFCSGGGFAEVVCVSSLGLGVFNLLPVETMDGGRMVWCLLAATVGERAADAVVRVCTGVVLGAVWLLSVYGMLVAGELVGVFGFAVCLLMRLMAGRENE